MIKNNFVKILIVLVFILFAVMAVSAQDANYYWKIGHNNAPDSLRDIAAKKFKEVVEEKTENKVKIDIYPSAVLGTEQEMLESLQMGGLDIQITGCGSLVNFVPQFGAVSIPFLFESY